LALRRLLGYFQVVHQTEQLSRRSTTYQLAANFSYNGKLFKREAIDDIARDLALASWEVRICPCFPYVIDLHSKDLPLIEEHVRHFSVAEGLFSHSLE